MSKVRLSWIDICRGIGILCVIYAHGLSEDKFRFLFYAFHIPLFFFLSGVTLHHKQHENTLQSLKKAFRGILLPYFLFAFICYGLWLIPNIPNFQLPGFIQVVTNILYGNGSGKQFFYNAVLWFLPCLFITRVFFTALSNVSNKTKVLLPLLILCSVGGYLLATFYPQLKLPFESEIVFSSVVFFGLGYLYNSNPKLKSLLERRKFTYAILFTVFTILIASINFYLTGHQVDMRLNRIGNYFLFYLAAICGIGMCVCWSHIIRANKILEFLGKNSMILFVFHLIIFTYISKILFIWLVPTTISHYRNLFFAPLYSIISILLISSGLKIYQRLLYNKTA
jgi:fucose 4-O-acetylase-like acetyltransferase